jgi:hypothetical protein
MGSSMKNKSNVDRTTFEKKQRESAIENLRKADKPVILRSSTVPKDPNVPLFVVGWIPRSIVFSGERQEVARFEPVRNSLGTAIRLFSGLDGSLTIIYEYKERTAEAAKLYADDLQEALRHCPDCQPPKIISVSYLTLKEFRGDLRAETAQQAAAG